MNETIIIHTLLGVLFLVIGSFISAVTYRIPRDIGFVKGRSFCDSCKKELYWYDNIPLISFLLYIGKSRCCNKNIPVRYPLIELFSAVGGLSVWLLFNNPVLVVLFFLTLTIFIIDLEYQIIPDELSWIVLVISLFGMMGTSFVFLFSGFICSLLLLSLNIITGGRGMGLGDIKLAIGLGVWFTLIDGLIWLTASFIIGGIVASILLILKRANLKTKIAFGPFLILGFWLTLIFTKLYQ
jgi:leader peptidase (prepilin peptidase)/N-methyltransferase